MWYINLDNCWNEKKRFLTRIFPTYLSASAFWNRHLNGSRFPSNVLNDIIYFQGDLLYDSSKFNGYSSEGRIEPVGNVLRLDVLFPFDLLNIYSEIVDRLLRFLCRGNSWRHHTMGLVILRIHHEWTVRLSEHHWNVLLLFLPIVLILFCRWLHHVHRSHRHMTTIHRILMHFHLQIPTKFTVVLTSLHPKYDTFFFIFTASLIIPLQLLTKFFILFSDKSSRNSGHLQRSNSENFLISAKYKDSRDSMQNIWCHGQNIYLLWSDKVGLRGYTRWWSHLYGNLRKIAEFRGKDANRERTDSSCIERHRYTLGFRYLELIMDLITVVCFVLRLKRNLDGAQRDDDWCEYFLLLLSENL